MCCAHDLYVFQGLIAGSVGRTARAGRGGLAITLISEHDIELVHAIEAHVGVKMQQYDVVKVRINACMTLNSLTLSHQEDNVLQSMNEVNLARRAGVSSVKYKSCPHASYLVACLKLLELDFGEKRSKYSEIDGVPSKVTISMP